MNASLARRPTATGRNTILVLAIALAVLHQDFWWWNSDYLVFGFMPTGLASHVCLSVMAACLWALAIKIAWPHHLEALAEETEDVTKGFSVEEAQDTDGVGEF